MGLFSSALGAVSGGLVGDDVFGLDITGAGAAADAANAGNRRGSAAETEMFDKNMAFQQQQWDWQKEQAAPWQQAGLQGLQGYQGLLQDPSSITQDPGYQFRLNQGMQGIENSASARGMGLSGATLKGIGRFGQDYASNEYGNALGRQQTLANFGMGMTSNIMGQGANYAGSVGGAYGGQGKNLSNMFMNQGQINAAQSGAGLNNLLGMGNLAASFMSGGAVPSGMMGNTGGGGGAGALNFQPNIPQTGFWNT